MPALIEAGVSKQQLLTVWDTNGDTGFTPAQLLTAGISIAEMRSNSIPYYLLFNQACNTPISSGTAPGPTIKLLSTNLNATNTHIVLEGKARDSIRWHFIQWQPLGIKAIRFIRLLDTLGATTTRENVTAEYSRVEGMNVVSTLNIPLSYVFSNFTLTVADTDGSASEVSIQLCPGR